MKRISVLALTLVLLVTMIGGAAAQEEEEGHPIVTTATNAVGIGTYVAAEAYGAPAGEDPEAEPARAIVLPYAIHPNMHVMEISEFEQPEPLTDMAFEWSLAVPEGSAAELLADGPVAIFLADVGGSYDLSLTITDANGNAGSTTWTVVASTYVGVGNITGDLAPPECAICHTEATEGWDTTGHADMFVRGINGVASDHYGEGCIWCHTTGYNDMETAVNGGFDDVAAEAGWAFPEELTEGTWDSIKEEYPEVAAMANIQCESCHGPGGDHVTGDPLEMGPMGTGLAYGTCAQCHAEEPYHIYPQQWENSGHADKTSQSFTYPIGEGRESCVMCHSGAGFVDAANGEEELRTDYQTITCGVCHDPHSAEHEYQLRVFESVTLPTGDEVTGAGPSATCMSCHNARRDPIAAVEGDRFSTPHYSNAAELISDTGGYDWGEDLPTGPHNLLNVEDACVVCHMAPSPGKDDDGNPLPGFNEMGGHTFAMSTPDGLENVAACQQCHGEDAEVMVETLDPMSEADYDGDGEVETQTAEVAGLLEVLEGAIVEAGVEVLEHHPYFNLPEDADEDLKGAVYNLKFGQSGGAAVHNFPYTVGLLQLSYEILTGDVVPGAEVILD